MARRATRPAPRARALRRAAALVCVAAALVVGAAPAALAEVPASAVVTGEPSAAEIETIAGVWREFTALFAPQSVCLGPVEVKVVARAEDWYGGRDVGPIAAFYRVPPDAIVFIEHGKVDADNLAHEFAHHLDRSCGIGESPSGRAFLTAQGFDPHAAWLTGPAWSRVPAEGFAEAVVVVLGGVPSITIGAEALRVVWDLARVPVRLGTTAPLHLGATEPGELARVIETDHGVLAAL